MKFTEQTEQQLERVINKIAQKFPNSEDATIFTDIHLCVSQESGEMLAYDDDEQEITRCVVEQWIDNQDEDFYEQITNELRKKLATMSNTINQMGIVKPFSFVLENDDHESISELYVADDDTIIVGEDLMQNLEEDLDNFINELLKED